MYLCPIEKQTRFCRLIDSPISIDSEGMRSIFDLRGGKPLSCQRSVTKQISSEPFAGSPTPPAARSAGSALPSARLPNPTLPNVTNVPIDTDQASFSRSVDPPGGGAGPFLRRIPPHPGGGVQPTQGLGASQQPFSSPRTPHPPIERPKKFQPRSRRRKIG